MINLRERGAITLYVAPLVGLIAMALAAGLAYNVWWRSQPTVPLDLNTSTVSDLTVLSGVDKPTVEKIINGRPHTRTDELVHKRSFRKPPTT